MNVVWPNESQHPSLQILRLTVDNMPDFAADDDEKFGKLVGMKRCIFAGKRVVAQIGSGNDAFWLTATIPGYAMESDIGAALTGNKFFWRQNDIFHNDNIQQ